MFIPKQETLVNINIEKAEKKYNAKYIGDFCVKSKSGGWANLPVACFYQENPPENYGHYFGLYEDLEGYIYICDCSSAFSESITGVVAKNGEVIWSRFRHDYRVSGDESVFIDGGRDYIRSAGGTFVDLSIDKGEIKIRELKNVSS